MPFSVYNSLGTFQSYINNALRDYLDDFYFIYLNNIFIYSNNPFKYTKYIKKVLEHFRDIRLYINLKKCKFLVTEVKYLGLIITIKGVCIDPKKVYIITKW